MKLFANNCSFGRKRQNTKSSYSWSSKSEPSGILPNPNFTAKIWNYSRTTVVSGQNVKIQSRMILKIRNRRNFAHAAKIWNYSQAPVVLDQNVKIQSRHIADPQNRQPVDFCQALYFTAKIRNYSQTTVVLDRNVKMQSHMILKIWNQWHFAQALFYC